MSDTAFLIAECRALESARPDALFHDPLAARLSGDKGRLVLEAFPRGKMTMWLTAVRTVIIDEYIQAAIARGVDTVLNLGTGLDTRPYRMQLPPSVQWIEADYEGVIDYKEQLLSAEQPVCSLERFAVDLADDAARSAFLAMVNARAERVLVLTEGVVPYLDVAQAGALADDLRAMRCVDGWIVDYIAPQSHTYRERAGVTRHMKHAPFKFRPENWIDFFASHGWKPREVRYLGFEGRRLGRRAPLPTRTRILMNVVAPFISKERRQAFGKFAGYVLLEPATPVAGQ